MGLLGGLTLFELTVSIALLSLVGYWLGSDNFYGVARFTGIALQTSDTIESLSHFPL